MSKQVLLVNAILAGLAVFCAASLVRDLSHARPLPPPPAPRRVVATKPADDAPAAATRADALGAYNVIVAKHLFNPSRTEAGAAGAVTPTAPPPPKPMLLGVIVDGARSRAYLEDATSKRVLSYQVGDNVSGGRIEQITSEKVLIVRPDGPMEVLLRDPSKPRPAGPTSPAPPSPGAGPVPPARVIRRPDLSPAAGPRQ